MNKGVAKAWATLLLSKPFDVVERRLAELSDDQRETVVQAMWSIYHEDCAKGAV